MPAPAPVRGLGLGFGLGLGLGLAYLRVEAEQGGAVDATLEVLAVCAPG